jgi:hypothetical protein
MAQRPSKPVESPYNYDIAGASVIKQLGQSGPVIDSAGGPVGEDPGAASLRQCIQLQGFILISS